MEVAGPLGTPLGLAQRKRASPRDPRVFADDARGWQCPFVLCLHPQGCLRRGVRASLRGLQETRVATREESGVLGFPSSRWARKRIQAWDFLVVKSPRVRVHLPMQEEETGSIPGSGRSPGGEHGNPLHYSYLENPMDRGAWLGTYVT